MSGPGFRHIPISHPSNATRSRTMNRISVPPAAVAIAIVALVAAMLVLPLVAHGQTTGQQGFFVAIPDVFPDIEARALIIREPGKEVLLLRREEATAEVLAMSLVTLRRVRRDNPRLEHGEMIPVVNFVITRDMTDGYRARMEELLARLADRPTTNVGNLGRGRWIWYRER